LIKVKRLVAEGGCRARKMLHRICLLAETPKGADHTLLTLIIVEGDHYKAAREQLVQDLTKDHEAGSKLLKDNSATTDIKETLAHDLNSEEMVSTITLTITKGTEKIKIEKKIPTKTLYPRPVASYTCCPLTDDLEVG